MFLLVAESTYSYGHAFNSTIQYTDTNLTTHSTAEYATKDDPFQSLVQCILTTELESTGTSVTHLRNLPKEYRVTRGAMCVN
jgi:hypothetical protein